MVVRSEMCVIAVKVRVNALIKRASLFIQQCKDPSKDPELSFADFSAALELDPDNADIYHHRGQVGCLLLAILLSIISNVSPSGPPADRRDEQGDSGLQPRRQSAAQLPRGPRPEALHRLQSGHHHRCVGIIASLTLTNQHFRYFSLNQSTVPSRFH